MTQETTTGLPMHCRIKRIACWKAVMPERSMVARPQTTIADIQL